MRYACHTKGQFNVQKLPQRCRGNALRATAPCTFFIPTLLAKVFRGAWQNVIYIFRHVFLTIINFKLKTVRWQKKKRKKYKRWKCKFRCPIGHGPDQSILRVSPGVHHAQVFGASPKAPYIFGVLENLGHGKCKLVVLRPCFMKSASFWNLLPRRILHASNHTRKRTLAWPAKCVQVPKRGGKQKCKLQFVATPIN